MSPDAPANAEQVKYWSDDAGPRWVALQERSDAMLRPFGRRAMEAAGLAGGERVLDVGAGCGDTTLELARRVGASGHVHAVDISAVMLERARERASREDVRHASFQVADPQSQPIERAPHDVVFSRFGVMFFDDPPLAFRRLRDSTRRGARLAACTWRGRDQNAWLAGPMKIAAGFLDLPPAPDPHAPGPFGLFDRERTTALLREAGWADVSVEPFDADVTIGGARTVEDALDFAVGLGPLAPALEKASSDARTRTRDALRAFLAAHAGPEGVVMPAAAWIVTARHA